MKKRLLFCSMAIITAFAMPATALALGFDNASGYTYTTPRYTIETADVVLVYNKELWGYIDYTEVWSGSDIYIPVWVEDDEDGDDRIATAKEIKEDNVGVIYKATVGDRYIDNVSIVDGGKDKVKNLDKGAYIKLEVADNYTGTSTSNVTLNMVLTVNNVSYQETRVELDFNIANRLEFIDSNSVYGAQVPTRFKVTDSYRGNATFDMGDNIKYTAAVKRSGRYAINFNRDPDYDIDLMYPDAYLEFYNFLGDNDTFESVGTLEIPIDTKSFQDKDAKQPRVYAYEILENKSLRALGSDAASYDAKKQILSIRTKTLGNYVLSNQKLKQTVEGESDDVFQSGYANGEEVAGEATEAAPQSTPPQAAPTPTNNPGTGGVTLINADNPPNSNPLTGAARTPVPALLVCAAALAGALLLKRK